jgi:hypothetical protein
VRIPAWLALSLLLLLTALIARWPRREPNLTSVRALLDSGMAPWIAGLACALGVGYVWGSLDPVPIYHDEAAYLLQARLFAHGVIAGAPAPLREFFEQFHVFVSPVLAPKYPPGFALAMVPGIWLGAPALIPITLAGITGGLLFQLSRRIAGGPVALLATVIWTLAPANLFLHVSYFSQTLTSALWLIGWWALLNWREDRRMAHLVLLGVVLGWLAITRPFTALLYALPLGVVLLRDVIAQRAWRGLGVTVAAGSLILLLLPIHNRLVTGQWLELPYTRYATAYLPFDRMGFGLRISEPLVSLAPDMVAFSRYFEAIHQSHTVSRIPATLADRTIYLLSGLSNGAPALFGALILLGLFRAPATALFAALSTAILLLGHLAYAHPPEWILYYEEGFPVLACLAALGVGRLIDWVLRIASSAESRPTAAARRSLVLMIASLGLMVALPRRLIGIGRYERGVTHDQTLFRDMVRALPGRSIVFVRYGPNHVMHFSLIANPPDYQAAQAWIVYDRGDDNRRLMAIAPDRVAYLYLEEQHRLVPIQPGANGPH